MQRGPDGTPRTLPVPSAQARSPSLAEASLQVGWDHAGSGEPATVTVAFEKTPCVNLLAPHLTQTAQTSDGGLALCPETRNREKSPASCQLASSTMPGRPGGSDASSGILAIRMIVARLARMVSSHVDQDDGIRLRGKQDIQFRWSGQRERPSQWQCRTLLGKSGRRKAFVGNFLVSFEVKAEVLISKQETTASPLTLPVASSCVLRSSRCDGLIRPRLTKQMPVPGLLRLTCRLRKCPLLTCHLCSFSSCSDSDSLCGRQLRLRAASKIPSPKPKSVLSGWPEMNNHLRCSCSPRT